MVNKAKSLDRKRRALNELKEKWMTRAVKLYRDQDNKPEGEKRLSLREICRITNEDAWREEKKHIGIDKQTLSRRINGIPSQAQSNSKRGSWLTDEEATVIIDYANQMAKMGWPLSRRRIQEHAHFIMAGRLGGDWPGFGKNWIDRFISKHSTRLKGRWSHALDTARARAGNPVSKKGYFDNLKFCIEGKDDEDPVLPENMYGVDESGFQEGIGLAEMVYGDPNSSIQHQQRSGNRENITVIVTICADGTSLPPMVIFKGEHFQTSWKQNNPLEASLGHSKKGYTDGEIGVEWIKLFDKHTKAKAKGQRRLLLVDGHNSHYTRGFLEYAREHDIRVLCYPSHSTHLYQGLDVVIFSVLKRAWTRHRDDFERETGRTVSKSNFLEIYGKAHIEALTRNNILAAFKKTGVVPFNPDVITEDMLAPSLTSSSLATLPLPIMSPVKVLVDLLDRQLAQHQAVVTSTESQETLDPAVSSTSTPSIVSGDIEGPQNTPDIPDNTLFSTPVRHAVQELESTSLSHLVSSSPPTSSMPIPLYMPYTISPFKTYHEDLLNLIPKTENEKKLQAALREAEERDRRRKRNMVTMQGMTILQNQYVKKVNRHLHGNEEEKERKKKKNRLFGDGLSKVLDSDEFFQQVVEHEEQAKKKEEEKASKKDAREMHAQALASWKVSEDARKQRNNEIRANYREALAIWKAEQEAAKLEGKRAKTKKPLQGTLEKGVPRPKKADLVESDEEGDDDDEENDEDRAMSCDDD